MTSRRTITQSARFGVAQSLRNARLVLVVWLVFAMLAWVASLPAWRWFDSVLSLAPEGDRLLGGLNFALLRELTHYDRSPTREIAMGSAFTFFLIALALNPFVAGGTLGVLASAPGDPARADAFGLDPSPRARGERARVRGVTRCFVGDGVRRYWPFARVLLLVGMLGVALTMLLTTGLEALGTTFDESGWPRASMWNHYAMLLAWLMIFGLCSLIVDTSRIFLIRRDDDRAAAAVRQALSFLWRNAGAAAATALSFGALLVATIALYNLIATAITPLSWALIAFTIIWQQLFALTRTTLRIAFLAAFTDLIAAREPLPLEAPATITPLDEPVYDLPMLG